mgnify:CR=1 FL=1
MRITGQRAGIRVFAALDVDVKLKTDTRSSEYLAERSRALAHFARKHPGASVLEIRLMKFKESDHAW